MVLAPPAPHAPFTPAQRHQNKFPNATALRTPAFNYTPIDVSTQKYLFISKLKI